MKGSEIYLLSLLIIFSFETKIIKEIKENKTIRKLQKANSFDKGDNGVIFEPPETTQEEISLLLLLGFGDFTRDSSISSNIYYKVYFYKISGPMPSKQLDISLKIDYPKRLLRLLEEEESSIIDSNCTMDINDDSNETIEIEEEYINYKGFGLINPDKKNIKVSVYKDKLSFKSNEQIKVIWTFPANDTKNHLELQENPLDVKNFFVLNNTNLVFDEKIFNLTGNINKMFEDKELTIILEESKEVKCSIAQNGEKSSLIISCIPEESIKSKLEGKIGKTESDKVLFFHFNDLTKDEVDIQIKRNTDIMSFVKESGLSGGKKAIIIVISSVTGLIIFWVVFALVKYIRKDKSKMNTSEKINCKTDGSKIFDPKIYNPKIYWTKSENPKIKT